MENKWDKLSMRQRADLIKLFVKNGVTSLDDMRQQYNSFQDGGPVKKTFGQWKEEMGQRYPWLDLDSEKARYDYERYFNENYDDAVSRLTDSQPRHFTDRYKLPNHPTFSNESVYSQGPRIGGEWTRDGKFRPSVINQQQYPNIYKQNRPYTEEEIYSKKYADGGFLDGPDDPPSGNNPNENQPYIKFSPQDVLKSRYKEVTRKLDPIEFLNSYVNSQAFEDKAPSDWYIRKARKNVESFDRVHTPSTDNWFQRQITDYHPHQSWNSIYTVDEDYSFALPANDYMRAGTFPKDEIVAHEYGHIIDPKKNITDRGFMGPEEYLGLSDAYKDAFQGTYGTRGHRTKDGTELNSHDSSQVEKYADLQALRYKLYSKGIYDIRKGEEFNEEHYDKAVKLIKNDRLLDIYNKDEIIKLMNTIADSNMDSEDYFLNYPTT